MQNDGAKCFMAGTWEKVNFPKAGVTNTGYVFPKPISFSGKI